ncbi:hypothetical protein J1614_010651 [Plenodomus biglobosus]|nr:hypothetical protein J1614_010651 [Plenodomus biglobosus]
MASILKLPAELLEAILALSKPAGLSALSRSCKHLYRYISPLLYHSIDWCWKDDTSPPPFQLLLRTLVANRQLASNIRKIRLRGGGIVRKDYWRFGDCELNERNGPFPIEPARSVNTSERHLQTLFNPLERWHVHNLIRAIASSRASEWYAEVARGNVDAIVSLILHQCQAVEELDLGFGYIFDSKFIALVFRRSMDRTVPYPGLERVMLGTDGLFSPKGAFIDMDILRMFFTLPKLRQLTAMAIEPAMFTWISPDKPPQAASLVNLVLHNSTLLESSLDTILASTPMLRHLTYDFHRLVDYGSHWQCMSDYSKWLYLRQKGRARYRPDVAISGPVLTRALSRVCKTLETLVLKVQFECDLGSEACGANIRAWDDALTLCHIIGRIRGLNCFHNLRHLEISWVLLFGWWDADLEQYKGYIRPTGRSSHPDPYTVSLSGQPWTHILPPNIERLCLRDDMSGHDNYPHHTLNPFVLTEKLLEARRTEYTRLKQVDFGFIAESNYSTVKPDQQWSLRLRVMCAEEGVKCEVTRQVQREVDGMSVMEMEQF